MGPGFRLARGLSPFLLASLPLDSVPIPHPLTVEQMIGLSSHLAFGLSGLEIPEIMGWN